MKNYEGANIRNVACVGHSHSGKTSLVSAMLFTAGATQRLGRVDEGNTVTDYDEEEIARHMSISAGHGLRRVGQDQDQPHRHAWIQHVHSRSRDGDACGGSRAGGGRCGQRRGGSHRAHLELLRQAGAAPRHRVHPHGSRARRLHARDGVVDYGLRPHGGSGAVARRLAKRASPAWWIWSRCRPTPTRWAATARPRSGPIPANMAEPRPKPRTRGWWSWWPKAMTR